MIVVLAAITAALIAGTIAALAPRPADPVGVVAVAGVAALAVLVGWLAHVVRDRDRRLDRIERAVTRSHPEVDDARRVG